MAYTQTFTASLAIALGLFPLASRASEPVSRGLIEKAIAFRNSDRILPRYTYFELKKTQNRTPKGKLFIDDTTLYEYTWIGDLAYARIVEVKGKPLKGKELAAEQARYDKAVAGHGGLRGIPAKVQHAYLLDTSLRLEPLLTSAYAVREASAGDLGRHSDPCHRLHPSTFSGCNSPDGYPSRHSLDHRVRGHSSRGL